MMVDTGVTIQGTKEASNYLDKKRDEIKRDINDGITRATLYMEGEVKQSISGHRAEPTSVDTGRFMGSVTHKLKGDTGNVFTNVTYAKYLEYGTSRMAPRYHFRNSLERNRKKIKEIIAKQIKK